MLESILNLEGVQTLEKKALKLVNGAVVVAVIGPMVMNMETTKVVNVMSVRN